MLALELVAAEKHVVAGGSVPPMTFIFDEVDAGVGGKTAVELGARLAKLAQSAQVIVVTHLPQVASWADEQYVVAKGETDDGSIAWRGACARNRSHALRQRKRGVAGTCRGTAQIVCA